MTAVDAPWKTSVGALLTTFRQALVALVPAMDQARIPWQDGYAYDDWDDIASALFRNIVERSLQHAREVAALTQLPAYGMLLPSYRDCPSIIRCTTAEQPPGLGLVFVSLSTQKEPFDTVTCARTDSEHGQDGVLSVPFAQCDFTYVSAWHVEDEVRSLTVDL